MDEGVEGGDGLRGDGALAHPCQRPQGEEPRGHVPHAVGVDSGPAAVVARVEGGEDVAHLPAPALAQDEAVGAHAHRGAHQLGQGHPARPLHIGAPLGQVHAVGVVGAQFRCLLDAHDALVGGDQRQDGREQRRLPAARLPRDEHVGAHPHQRPQQGGDPGRQRAAARERVDGEVAPPRRPEGDERARGGHGREHGVQPHSALQSAVHDRARVVEALPARRGHPDREAAHVVGAPDIGCGAHEPFSPVHPHLGAVDQDVGDARVGDEGRQGGPQASAGGAQARQAPGDLVGPGPGARPPLDGLGQALARGERPEGGLGPRPPGAPLVPGASRLVGAPPRPPLTERPHRGSSPRGATRALPWRSGRRGRGPPRAARGPGAPACGG